MGQPFAYDVALIIGVGQNSGFAAGKNHQRFFPSREVSWYLDGLEAGGCRDVTVRVAGPTDSPGGSDASSAIDPEAVLGEVSAFARKLAAPHRPRGLLGLIGFGGYSANRGLFLALDPGAFGGPDHDHPALLLRDVAARLDEHIPRRAITLRLGCCFTAAGRPNESFVWRTVTPDAIVPSGEVILRPVDNLVGPPPDGTLANSDVRTRHPSGIGILGAFACPVEVWGGEPDVVPRWYTIQGDQGAEIGIVAVAGPNAVTTGTNLQAQAAHWKWLSAPAFPPFFRLVWNPQHGLTSLPGAIRFAHLPFPGVTQACPAFTTDPSFFSVARGPIGSTAAIPMVLRVTRSGADVTGLDWFATSAALGTGGYVNLGSAEVLEFTRLDSGPVPLPPSGIRAYGGSTL